MSEKKWFYKKGRSLHSTARQRAQASLEYLLILSGVVLLAMVVFLITSGLLNLTAGAANATAPLYNQTQSNYSATQTPLPGFPCAARCTATANCLTACGASSGYICNTTIQVCYKP